MSEPIIHAVLGHDTGSHDAPTVRDSASAEVRDPTARNPAAERRAPLSPGARRPQVGPGHSRSSTLLSPMQKEPASGLSPTPERGFRAAAPVGVAAARVLLLEPQSADLRLAAGLKKRGLEVLQASSAETALPMLLPLPDVVLVAAGFPSTKEVVAAFAHGISRRSGAVCPLLMLVAVVADGKNGVGEADLVEGVMPQIIAAAAGQRAAAAEDLLIWDDLVLDITTHRVSCDGRSLHLSRKSFLLLAVLMREPQRTLTRAELLERVWGPKICVEPRTLDVHIRRLRVMLRSLRPRPVIFTVRSLGYTLNPRA